MPKFNVGDIVVIRDEPELGPLSVTGVTSDFAAYPQSLYTVVPAEVEWDDDWNPFLEDQLELAEDFSIDTLALKANLSTEDSAIETLALEANLSTIIKFALLAIEHPLPDDLERFKRLLKSIGADGYAPTGTYEEDDEGTN